MRILDRYIVKQFFQIFLFGILAFMGIFVILDLMENLDNFLDKNVPTDIILQYYIYFIPEIVRLIMPVAVLLGALFTVGRMSSQNELAAMKASGVSMYRYMMPFIFSAFLVSLFGIYFGGYIVPSANKAKTSIDREYLKRGIIHAGSNIYFQDSRNRIVTIGYYDVSRLTANRVSIQEFDPEDITRMLYRFDISQMVYDTTNSNWTLKKGIKREFNGNSERLVDIDTLTISYLNFTPDEVLKKQQIAEEMTLTELKDLADSQLRSGNDPRRALIDFHTRIAFPFSSFVVILFGIPLSANKRKGGLAIQFITNVLITFLYLVMMNIVNAAGKNGVLNPILTAWLVNIIFFILASVNILFARK